MHSNKIQPTIDSANSVFCSRTQQPDEQRERGENHFTWKLGGKFISGANRSPLNHKCHRWFGSHWNGISKFIFSI